MRWVGCPRSPQVELIQPFVAVRRAYASKSGPLIAPNLPPLPRRKAGIGCALFDPLPKYLHAVWIFID